MSKSYKDDSIQSLSPLEFTRLRPGVYVGNTDYSTQLLVEVASNAIDEFTIGHGDTIRVDVLDDNVVEVEDNAQGFPINVKRDDKKTVLEAAFSVLNTSAKYSDDGIYEGNVLGLNGIGAKLACYLSHWLEVLSWRQGKFEHIWFKEGVFEKREIGKWTDTSKPSGTLVRWQPSEEFFTSPKVENSRVEKLFNTLVSLCPGLTILLNGKRFYSNCGLVDLLDKEIKEKEIIKNRFIINFTEGKHKLDLIMTYTNNFNNNITSYVNMGETDSGPHLTQIKTILTREFNRFFRDKGWMKEKEENLSGEDIQEGVYLISSFVAPGVSYDSQTKSRIVKLEMGPFARVISDELRSWMEQNEKEVKLIADKALSARKAREAAKKARDAVRQPKEKKKQFLNLPTKLVDCWSKNRAECELFIVEGDSAAGGLVEGRDAQTVAVFPIRGKIISAYKNSNEKIFANQEVVNLIKAIGLELDPKTNKLIYDAKKLRYGKILFAADADSDGASIRNLLAEMIWWLCPELIENGHVYTTMPPLFRITTSKNEYIFLKDVIALEEYKAQHIGETFKINRNKG